MTNMVCNPSTAALNENGGWLFEYIIRCCKINLKNDNSFFFFFSDFLPTGRCIGSKLEKLCIKKKIIITVTKKKYVNDCHGNMHLYIYWHIYVHHLCKC